MKKRREQTRTAEKTLSFSEMSFSPIFVHLIRVGERTIRVNFTENFCLFFYIA